jgi:cytochrome c2
MSLQRRVALRVVLAFGLFAACGQRGSESSEPAASSAASTNPPLAQNPGAVMEPPSGKGRVNAEWFSMPEDPAVGAERFETFKCAACHAVGGGGARGAPNLGRADLRSGFLEGTARMWNRIPGMSQRMDELHVPWPRLSGDDLLNLVAFFTTYQYYLTNVGQPGRPDVGQRLLKDKGCRECHAVESDEKLTGPSLKQFGGGQSTMVLAQAMWNHAPGMQRMVEKKRIARPYFREREMADLLAFLATAGKPEGTVTAYVEPGSPARGAKRFHSLQCDHCHPLRGEGGIREAREGEPPPPDLARDREMLVRDHTDIAALMWNHGVGMSARMESEGIERPALKDTDLADLIAFLFFANFMDEPGDPARGREVFENRACVSCHLTERGATSAGPNLAETRLGGASTPQAVMAAMWRAAPGMRQAMLQRGIEWPILKPSEVRDLVAYLLQVSGSKVPKPAAKSEDDDTGTAGATDAGTGASDAATAPKAPQKPTRSGDGSDTTEGKR